MKYFYGINSIHQCQETPTKPASNPKGVSWPAATPVSICNDKLFLFALFSDNLLCYFGISSSSWTFAWTRERERDVAGMFTTRGQIRMKLWQNSRVSASHFSCWGAIAGWHQVSKDMHAWPRHPNQLLRHPGPQKLSEGLLPEAAIGWNDSEWSTNHSQTTKIKI